MEIPVNNAKIEAVLPLLFNLRNTGWKQAAPIIEGMIMHMEYVV